MIGIFGNIVAPDAITKYNNNSGNAAGGGGLFIFISNIFKFTVFIGGIYLILQLILAGYAYISANGDVKKTEAAWTKIWQSLLGFVIIAAAFVIASIIGKITGIEILTPQIYGPQ